MHAEAHGPGNWFWMGPGFRGRGGFRAGRAWWMGAMGDPPPRAERGEIRYLVLDAIKERPRHGYEVIQHIEERAGGTYRPSPGVIYPTLQMLEELGHANVVEQEGRKAYAITDAGRAELAQNQSSVDDFYGRVEEEPWEAYAEEFSEIMRRLARLMKTFKLAARQSRLTPETLRSVGKIIDEALGRIDDVLRGQKR
ncbi:MAG TPA: PadR family transcriptional regulator [Polyangiaceae bacterium]|nr:PadR family transcriptional regulator [Polyangiaceae bacterium]